MKAFNNLDSAPTKTTTRFEVYPLVATWTIHSRERDVGVFRHRRVSPRRQDPFPRLFRILKLVIVIVQLVLLIDR